jgi:hypothetical protein
LGWTLRGEERGRVEAPAPTSVASVE